VDIDNVPAPVWQLLAKQAKRAVEDGEPVLKSVDDYFYDHVYRRWTADFQPISYKPNLHGVIDIGWAELAKLWKKGAPAKVGDKDQSKGVQAMQVDDNDPSHKGTRLGEKYSDAATPARFQFLVSAGGGMVLLNRMRRACQQYIAEHDATVVQWWKVFGESFAEQGQSDACVVYLLLAYDDPLVTEFIEGYLWPNVKDIVNDKFVPVGLVRIGSKPLWATWLPDRQKWAQVLGAQTLNTHYGSAGGLMGLVFGHAFANAIKARSSLEEGALTAAAKGQARAVIAELKS